MIPSPILIPAVLLQSALAADPAIEVLGHDDFAAGEDADGVFMAVLARQATMTRCLVEGSARGRADLSGEVAFSIFRQPEGSVERVVLRKSDLGDPDTELCLIQALGKAFFPSPPTGSLGEPLVFRFLVKGGATSAKPEVGPVVMRCYSSLSVQDPYAAGSLDLTVRLGPSGAMEHIDGKVSSVALEPLITCARQSLAGWQIEGVSPDASWTFHFQFDPAN